MLRIETPDSSNLDVILYNNKTKELKVQFKLGGIYSYKNVPPEVVIMVAQAESVGSAFYNLIRNGGYEYEKLGDCTDTMRL